MPVSNFDLTLYLSFLLCKFQGDAHQNSMKSSKQNGFPQICLGLNI